MYSCKNCNAPLSGSQKFCPVCGTKNEFFGQPDETAAAMEPAVMNNPGFQPDVRKKSRKPLVIILSVVIVALLAVSAFAAINALKSPKQRYIDAESKYFKDMFANIESEYNKAKEGMNKKYEQKMSLSVSPDLSNYSDYDAQQVQMIGNVIKDIRLDTDTKTDISKNSYMSDISLSYKNNVLINATIASGNDTEILKIPQLYDKTFVLNMNELDKFYENMGMSQMPKKILKAEDFKNAIKIDRKAFEKDMKQYAKIYFDGIPKDSVKAGKDSIEVGDKKINCRKITLNLEKEQLIEILSNLVETAKDDDVIKDTVFGNIKNIVDLLSDAGYIPDDYDIEDIIDDSKYSDIFDSIDDGIDDLDDNIDMDDGIVMSIWVGNDGKIIKREIESTLSESDYDYDINISYTGTDYSTDKLIVQDYSLLVENDSSNSDEKESFSLDISRESQRPSKASKAGNDNIEVSVKAKDGSSPIIDAGLEINSDRKYVKDVLTGDTDFSLDVSGVKVDGTISSENKENAKTKESTGDYDIDLSIVPYDGAQPVKGNVNLSLSMKPDVSFDVSSLTKDDTVEVEDLDSSDLMDISNEVQQNIQKLLQNNQDLFGALSY